MIHYYVGFSFESVATEGADLQRVRAFLADLVARGLVHDFKLLRNRVKAPGTKLPPFQAAVIFPDEARFSEAMQEVAHIGIHSGSHGAMIANADAFSAEVFEEVDLSSHGPASVT